jgi:hypothetical protein
MRSGCAPTQALRVSLGFIRSVAGASVARTPIMNADHNAELLPPRRGLRLLLPDHHLRIEAMCKELLASAYSGEPRELAAQWRELEAELLDHIEAEEEVIIPCYATYAPDDAERILAHHATLREILTPIGVEIELHEAHAPNLRRLVDALRAHAVLEDAAMYPWAERNLSQVARRLLYVRISRWFGR